MAFQNTIPANRPTWRGAAALCACLLISITALTAIAAGLPHAEDAVLSRAREIHARVFSIDTHVDIPGANYATPALDPGSPTCPLKCDLVKMKTGGLGGVFLAVFVGQRPDLNATGYKAAYDQAIAKFQAIDRLTKMYPEQCALARTPAEAERVHATGKRVILIGIENGYPIGEDVGRVAEFERLGARYITLVHGSHNQLADSAGPKEPLHNGLSELGKKVVAEMNRLGVMVDVSHASPKSYWDVIATSKAPIIASHSGCGALTPNPRNLDDEQLAALKKNGGVIQIVALGAYLKTDSAERAKALQALREEVGLRRSNPGAAMTDAERAEMEKKWEVFEQKAAALEEKFPGATLKDFVDHIDHAVKVAGIDHVGIGTDFDGGGGIKGFNNHAEAPNVTAELVRRGYSETDIRKIWGGNLLRVWRDVEKAAGK